MAEAFLGLGSNLGDSAENLREAVRRLGKALRIERVSSIYRTEPVGLREQPFFLNAALKARTELEPRELLSYVSGIEDSMGRQRTVPSGPRTIDLDLLVYDDLLVDEPDLSLPHPRLVSRRFVLAPLAEIAPDLRPGSSTRTVGELLAALAGTESVERILVPDWPPLPA